MSRAERLRPLAGLLAAGLVSPALAAPSQQFPTYLTGLQKNGSYVVSDGQVITPAGIQVNLGIRVRAKAVALNPNGSHTAAVLTMGATQPVVVFDTLTGRLLQNYLPFQDTHGTYAGISYSADGKYLMFSQDSSFVTFATVAANGLLSDYAHVPVPPNTSFITCFPNSPIGDYGAALRQRSTRPARRIPAASPSTSNGRSAYALLNQNNTLRLLRPDAEPARGLGNQIRVGNAPHSIVLAGAYRLCQQRRAAGRCGEEAISPCCRPAPRSWPIRINGSAATGTVSVVDTVARQQVTASIPGRASSRPAWPCMGRRSLLVANTYSDTISVIDMTLQQGDCARSAWGCRSSIPGSGKASYGAGPTGIAVDDQQTGIAYVALYNANAIAVVDLTGSGAQAADGHDPCGLRARFGGVRPVRTSQLIVANDKGIGTLASFETDHGVTGYNTHQDTATVSIVKAARVPPTSKR